MAGPFDVAVLSRAQSGADRSQPVGAGSSRTDATVSDEFESSTLTVHAPDLAADATATASVEPTAVDTRADLDTRPAASTPRPLGSGFRAWSSRYVAMVLAFDALVGLAASLFILAIAEATPLATSPDRRFALIAVALWPLAIAAAHGYERRLVGIGGDEMRALLRAALVVIALSAVPAGLLLWQSLLTMVVITAPVAMALSLSIRFLTRKRLHANQRQGQRVRRVVVVGGVGAAADLVGILQHETHCGMHVVGVCLPRSDLASARARGLDVVGDLEQIRSVVAEFQCDAVAVTSGDATGHSYLRELSWSLEGTDVELLVHPGLIEVAGPRMHIRPFVGLPLLYVEQPHFTGWRRLVKRTTDIVLSALGLLLISPVLALVALAIKLQDGGPVFFRQMRVGLEGRSFAMWKFRSMVVDAEARKAALLIRNEAEGPLFKMRQDPRVTRLGRFLRAYSVDELPQLVNVLRGSMSLVGPRPQLSTEVDRLQADARRRLLVTPGMTGLWQVSGRSDLGWEEAVRLDLRYVENWSLTMDLHILWKTFHAVVTKQGSR